MEHYSPVGRRNHGRPLKRLLDTWDRNGSTSGPTQWQIYGDDDDDYLEPGKTFRTIIGVETMIRAWHLPITRLARSRIYGTYAQTFNKTANVSIIYHQGAFMQPLFQWKINKYYIIRVYVSSLWYQACNEHAPLYYHLWPVRLYNNFSRYLINLLDPELFF